MTIGAGWLCRLTGRRSPVCAGVDVRQSEVRWVRYDRSRSSGIGAVSADRAPRSDLKGALREVAGRLNLTDARVSAAVESSRVVVRHTLLPPMPENEVGRAIAFQLPQLIPGYTDEWAHDYVLLGSGDQDADRVRECLVAALPRGVMLEYYNAFKQAGLILASLEVRTLALWRFLFGAGAGAGPCPPEAPCLAVLDPDDRTADLAVFENGMLRYTRLLAGWEADEGEDRIIQRLVSEVEESLSWYRDHRGHSPKALLVVHDAGAPGFDTLPARLGLKAYHGKTPWAGAESLAAGFAAAAGLAFKEVMRA